MNNQELMQKRVMPYIGTISEELQNLVDEITITESLKIARAMEPKDKNSPVLIGKIFRKDGKSYHHPTGLSNWMVSLDLTDNHNPENPLLVIRRPRKGMFSRESIMAYRCNFGVPLKHIEENSESLIVEPFYFNLRYCGGHYALVAKDFNFFNTFYEKWYNENRERKPLEKLSHFEEIIMIDFKSMPKEELKVYQEQAYNILDKREKLKQDLNPLEQEIANLQKRIKDIKNPKEIEIANLSKDLYKETLDSKLNVELIP